MNLDTDDADLHGFEKIFFCTYFIHFSKNHAFYIIPLKYFHYRVVLPVPLAPKRRKLFVKRGFNIRRNILQECTPNLESDQQMAHYLQKRRVIVHRGPLSGYSYQEIPGFIPGMQNTIRIGKYFLEAMRP